MEQLWASNEAGIWAGHLFGLEERIAALSKQKLTDLDRWYSDDLPKAVAARTERYLTKDEVAKVVDWKLTRGKWRPRLLGYAQSQDETVVREASLKAFSLLPDEGQKPSWDCVDQALKVLCELKGIGPATASALLSCCSCNIPFMSDELLAAAFPKSKAEYTIKQYQELVQRVNGKLSALEPRVPPWTARDVERAIWAAALQKVKPSNRTQSGASGSKRKR